MKKINCFTFSLLFLFSIFIGAAQEELNINIFKNQPVNFGGEKGDDSNVIRLQNGRIIYK